MESLSRRFCLVVTLFLCAHILAAEDLGQWIKREKAIALTALLNNISPSGTVRGVVIASPSTQNPNYFYHWVRDAALAMDAVVSLYEKSNGSEKEKYYCALMDYLDISRRNQTTPNLSGGLGEPRFHVDGSAIFDPWGRPQTDGPALRAITLIRFAHLLMSEGNIALVREKLYDGRIPTDSIIKSDLEYLSHHWRDRTFDLWEEVEGDHFYTRMVQRRALKEGARLARWLNDGGASDWYLFQASLLEGEISKHWDAQAGILRASLNNDGWGKPSGIDSSVILGVLHGDTHDGFFSPSQSQVLATAERIRETFQNLYPINREFIGTAIGRYPEDRYDGYSTGGQGNPWVLATSGFAEFYFRVARELRSKGSVELTTGNLAFFKALIHDNAHDSAHINAHINAMVSGKTVMASDPVFVKIVGGLRRAADDMLVRVKTHTGADGALSEQFNRHNGFMQGATHLSWSYASFLTAIGQRD